MPVKIIIVDDEPLIVEEMSETLTEEGYECFYAHSVDDGLLLLKNTKDIDIILTDLKMPKKTGADLIAAVQKEFDQQIKFIIMSGHRNIEIDGFDIKGCPYLKKPINIDDLLYAVATVLKSKET